MAIGQELQGYINNTSAQTGVPTSLLSAVAQLEQGGNWSPRTGYMGIETALQNQSAAQGLNPLDRQTNVNIAGGLLSRLYGQYGNWTDALSVYNAGKPASQSPQGANYASTVEGIERQYSGGAPLGAPAGSLSPSAATVPSPTGTQAAGPTGSLGDPTKRSSDGTHAPAGAASGAGLWLYVLAIVLVILLVAGGVFGLVAK